MAFKVLCTTQCRQIGYDIAVTARENKRLVKEKDRLKTELESLKSSKRISDIAEKKLGLAAPEAWQIVIIK